MILHLAADELECILPMARAFEKEISHPVIRLSEPEFLANWSRFIELGVGAVFAAIDGGEVVGVLSGSVVPCDLNGDTVAQETWWYVARSHRRSGVGRRLAEAFERYALERGAKRIGLGVIGHLPGADSLLRSMGYEPFETAYYKVIE